MPEALILLEKPPEYTSRICQHLATGNSSGSVVIAYSHIQDPLPVA